MDEPYLKTLLEKYVKGDCTPDEIVLLESWYLTRSKQGDITLSDEFGLHENRKIIWDNIIQKTGIQQQLPSQPNHKLLIRIGLAASILLGIFSGSYFLFHQQPIRQIAHIKSSKQDLSPGGNKAILILSNGKQVNLGSAKTGIIAKEATATVNKNKNGSVSYKDNGESSIDGKIAYNTIKTGRGGQWPEIILPDGTKVTLDAASSITYPTYFSGNERKVAITGQVYFEVAHNSEKPFRVTVKDQIIQDIGTAFNVNAYDDEPALITTLVEGSVSVTKRNQKETLRPGQQAITTVANNYISVKEANINEATDWKNGLFHFKHADLKTVMRQIARWYDVDVVYENQVSKADINGEVYRNMNVSKVFEVLNNLQVDLKIEGRKIIVTNKIK